MDMVGPRQIIVECVLVFSSHLRSHLFNYNLINTPFCENEVCDHVAETPSHYLLKCLKFANERRIILSEISEIVFPGINHNTIIDLMPDYFCRILIQGSDTLSLETNENIFRLVFKFIDESGRFKSITTMKTMHTTSSDMTYKRPHTLTHTHACTHAHVVSYLSFSLSLSLFLSHTHLTLHAFHRICKYVDTLCYCVY